MAGLSGTEFHRSRPQFEKRQVNQPWDQLDMFLLQLKILVWQCGLLSPVIKPGLEQELMFTDCLFQREESVALKILDFGTDMNPDPATSDFG